MTADTRTVSWSAPILITLLATLIWWLSLGVGICWVVVGVCAKDCGVVLIGGLLAAFSYRAGRIVLLMIAVDHKGLLVRRAISLGINRIPFRSVSRCVSRRFLGSEEVWIYLTRRWQAPAAVIACRRVAAWCRFVARLRELFAPQGKWEDRPWWKPLWW